MMNKVDNTRFRLMNELKTIYDNKNFVCGTISIAGYEEIWSMILDYIHSLQEQGEEISSDDIQLLALKLRKEYDEQNASTMQDLMVAMS